MPGGFLEGDWLNFQRGFPCKKWEVNNQFGCFVDVGFDCNSDWGCEYIAVHCRDAGMDVSVWLFMLSDLVQIMLGPWKVVQFAGTSSCAV